jgi:hypothetical protein
MPLPPTPPKKIETRTSGQLEAKRTKRREKRWQFILTDMRAEYQESRKLALCQMTPLNSKAKPKKNPSLKDNQIHHRNKINPQSFIQPT